MHITFSTLPLKCCHFTLQNVKRDKNDKPVVACIVFYFEN